MMEMPEDVETTIILGRPFMKTAKVIIDVDEGYLKLRTESGEAHFSIFQDLFKKEECHKVEECLKIEKVKKRGVSEE